MAGKHAANQYDDDDDTGDSYQSSRNRSNSSGRSGGSSPLAPPTPRSALSAAGHSASRTAGSVLTSGTFTGSRERSMPVLADAAVLIATAAGTAIFLGSRPKGAILYDIAAMGLGSLIYVNSGNSELQAIGGGMVGAAGTYLALRIAGRINIPSS